ncbi:MAG: hypothetical protein ACHP65_07775 [Legionellales bacterium]
MRTHEAELLNHIISLNALESDRTYDNTLFFLRIEQDGIVQQAFKVLQCEKLGTVNSDFIEDPIVVAFIDKQYDESLKFWYFIHTNDPAAIEEKIKEITSKYHKELERGRGIPPKELYSYTLIRSVYLSENPALIDIFKRYLPIPGVDVFKGYAIPTMVTDNKAAIEKSIQALRGARAPRLSLDEITVNVVKMQRQVRSKLRHQEEIKRIASREEWAYVIKKTSPERVIQDANTPHRPRCADRLLAKRIMVAAQQIRLFSTVKHWTSAKHIETIFNDSLYGRRRLLESYLPFRPASLYECDIEDGDGNVICFGPSEIDPKAMQPDTVEVLFDLDKISANNPSIFFKQRDLGFVLDKQRAVSINKSESKTLFFSHTNSVRCGRAGFAYLSVYGGLWNGLRGVATLPNYSLISYNVKNIHQILTLNFFRFLDAKVNEDFESIRNEIYADLAELSDKELLQCLEKIGQQLSDTSEFNFYGAHRIDFSTVIALSSYQDECKASYTLNLQDLIASLERNDISILNEAKVHIPGAFNSYRFLDYLLSKTTSILGRDELQRLRSKCITPSWFQSIPEPEPLVMPVDDFSAPVLMEEVTLPLDGLITTHNDAGVEAMTAKSIEPLREDSMLHTNAITMSVVPTLVNETLSSNIGQQDRLVIKVPYGAIRRRVIVDSVEENNSETDIRVRISEINQPIISSQLALIDEQDEPLSATLLDSQSNCLPSSFIISMYTTGSVLLIAGILACAPLNPVVGVLVTVGTVAGLSTWCGYFKPADTRRVEQSIVGPQFSDQTVLA